MAMSRGQKKRLAKRDQYLRKDRLIMASLKLKQQDEQKKRIDGLDAIKEALLSTVSSGSNSSSGNIKHSTTSVAAVVDEKAKQGLVVKTNKSRKALVEREVSQMNLVLQHPAFKADPFATIREHLKNTLAKDSQQQKVKAANYHKERKEKEEQKRVLKKENGAKKKRKNFNATRSKSR
jgi:ABC-type dipeptide/oligopeptide/nickel transport system ATPase subunit